MKKSLLIAMISVMSVSFGATAFANSNKVDPIRALTATVNAFQTTVNGLGSRVISVETAIADLGNKVANSNTSIKSNTDSIDALKQENASLKTRLDALEASQDTKFEKMKSDIVALFASYGYDDVIVDGNDVSGEVQIATTHWGDLNGTQQTAVMKVMEDHFGVTILGQVNTVYVHPRYVEFKVFN
jgi:peptidoglycan hydrolase CwlO-like protein